MQDGMRKKLKEYAEACRTVQELEAGQDRGKGPCTVSDIVKGSMAEHPYLEKRCHIEGMPCGTPESYLYQRHVINSQKEEALRIMREVEQAVMQAPLRIQRIIRFKYFQNLKWEEVADRMQGRATGESVRKELDRYFKEAENQASRMAGLGKEAVG